MNRVPYRSPRSWPDGSIAYMNLIGSIVTEIFFDMHN
jgi:hypothetical protein